MKAQTTENQTIKVNKGNKVYRIENNYIGWIDDSSGYKDWEIESEEKGTYIGNTFATSYDGAIITFFELIKDKEYGFAWIVDEYPKSKFTIVEIDGSWDNKNDRPKEKAVYSITAKKAKDYFNL